MKVFVLSALIALPLGLSACESAVKAPYDRGVCYSVTFPKGDGKPAFNKLAENQPQIEFCAARLEEMRVRFLRMGGSQREITGSYQGQYIFIDRAGVSFGKTLDGNRFMALARTGDGRLAIPGAIQRQIDAAYHTGPVLSAGSPPLKP